MALNTPWCPRCGAWRGFFAKLCAGCNTINEIVAQEFESSPPLGSPEREEHDKAYKKRLGELVGQRFSAISEKRTDREAYTQSLEEMVERNVETLKAVCMEWMRMRPDSRRTRFSLIGASELVEAARNGFEELGALSLELTQYTENKARHDEVMERVAAGMLAVERFLHPSEEPQAEKDPDLAPGGDDEA